MRDILRTDAARMTLVEDTFRSTLQSYGYDEIRLPLLERTELFTRGVGESTDAVSKEMYTLFDRDEESLALRPEGTASCVRAVLANGLLRGDRPRLWYNGPMFRYERPQKGRYREFQQFGAEAFGYSGPDVDVELLYIAEEVWSKLGIGANTELRINTLGNVHSRTAYRNALVDYLRPLEKELDPDSVRRLTTNPLRILDSKNAQTQELLADAPRLTHHLDNESQIYFRELVNSLDSSGIPYVIDERMVRGLDYYTHIVFEWHSEKLGAQSQIGGGGRYDGLVELLGGPSCPASGFAVGIDRIALVHQAVNEDFDAHSVDVYVIALDTKCEEYADKVARTIRQGTSLKVRKHRGHDKVKNQFRAADRSDAEWAIVIGEDEMNSQTVSCKFLRVDRPQLEVPVNKIIEFLMSSKMRRGEVV